MSDIQSIEDLDFSDLSSSGSEDEGTQRRSDILKIVFKTLSSLTLLFSKLILDFFCSSSPYSAQKDRSQRLRIMLRMN